MANDEAEFSKMNSGPGFGPESLHKTLAGDENPARDETPPPGTERHTENQSHGDLEADESQSLVAPQEAAPQDQEPVTPGLPGLAPEAAFANASSVNASRPAGEQAKPRALFPALAATAIAGGILGFGGTFALRHFGGSNGDGAAASRVAGLDARIDTLEGKADAAALAARAAIAALQTRVGAAETAANKAAESASMAQADLQKELAARPAEQEPAAAGANPPAAADPGPQNARIGSIEEKLSALETALAAPKADLRAPQQDRESLAAAPVIHEQAIAIVVESLLRTLESGGQFSGELGALENLGVPADLLAPLRAVPSATVPGEKQLATEFASLAPAIITTDPANQPSADEGFLDRVTRHAKGLVHVRRVGEAADTDTENLVMRIENALADHDLETAYKVWNQLSRAAMAKSESWGEAVKTRLDAINAAKSIEAGAVAVLGKPKS